MNNNLVETNNFESAVWTSNDQSDWSNLNLQAAKSWSRQTTLDQFFLECPLVIHADTTKTRQ